MTENSKIKLDIKAAVNSFKNFHMLLEADLSSTITDTEDVKAHFKLSHYVEQASNKMVKDGSLQVFLNIFADIAKLKAYNVDIYLKACEELLRKCFKTSGLIPSLVDKCVRMFLAFHSSESLENLFVDLILTQKFCSDILTFVAKNNDNIGSLAVEAQFVLHFWSDQLKKGETNEVTTQISNMLSNYKVKSNLSLLVKVLAIPEDTRSEAHKIVTQVLCEKMMDRSLMSKSFWLTMFKNVDKVDVVRVSCVNCEFFEHLMNFIRFVGNLLSLDDGLGRTDTLSVFSDINYNELLTMIKQLYNEPILKNNVKVKVESMAADMKSSIWNEIILELSYMDS